MALVQDGLVVGIRVNRRHQAMLDAEVIVEHLHHGGEAIGSAGGVGDDVMVLGIVHPIINAHHQGQVLAFGRRRDNHFAGTALQMARSLIGIREDASRLYDQVNTHLRPWNLGRISFGEDIDTASIHDKIAVARFNLTGVAAIVGVVFQKVGVGFSVGQVVDRSNLNLSGITALVSS